MQRHPEKWIALYPPCNAWNELLRESHGGALRLARQGRYQPSGRAAAAIAEKQAKEAQARSKMPEDRVPNGPPLELMRLRVYVEADQWARLQLIRAWGTEGWHGLVRQILSRDDPPPGDDREALTLRR